jgi:hypothetical protein
LESEKTSVPSGSNPRHPSGTLAVNPKRGAKGFPRLIQPAWLKAAFCFVKRKKRVLQFSILKNTMLVL